MRYIVLLAMLFALHSSYAQNLKLSAGFGFNVGEKETSKRFMFAKSLQAGVEYELNWNTSLIPSLEYKQFQYSYDAPTGANIFSKNSFIALPVVLRKYYNASKRSWLFTDLGISPSYYFSLNNEVRNTATPVSKIKTDGIGFNFGLVVATGVKTRINERQAFDVGLFVTKDLFAQKRSSEWMKNSTASFNITYYLALKKSQ